MILYVYFHGRLNPDTYPINDRDEAKAILNKLGDMVKAWQIVEMPSGL